MDKISKNEDSTEDSVEMLIRKRKEETDAFKKLLNAIEQRESKQQEEPKSKRSSKS